MKLRYTKEQLEQVAKESFSYKSCLEKLNLVPKGGNYEILKSKIKTWEIDISHFEGQGWRKNKTFKTERKKLENILCKNSVYKSGSPYQSNKIKGFLFKNNLKEEKCEKCGIKDWFGISLVFECHHVDGDKYNNEIDNLKILCPNCHSTTDNFRGKNIKRSVM